MRLIKGYQSVIWILVVALMTIGTITAYLYWFEVYDKSNQELACGCYKLRKNEIIFIMAEYKASIFGVKPIYLALVCFPVGLALSITALLEYDIAKLIITVSSLGLSISYVPYLINLLITSNIICIYCNIMQATIILTAILSIISYIYKYMRAFKMQESL